MGPAPVMERAAAALVAGDRQTARACFETAVARDRSPEALFGLGTALWWLGETDAAVRAHGLLARGYGEDRPVNAVAEARAAFTTFDALGATIDADETAAYLRGLRVRTGRTGPRGAPLLTRREQEVLALLAQGLSNQQVAERLFLTRKTVEHHVRSLLAKLGVSNRTEAAAFALRHLGSEVPNG